MDHIFIFHLQSIEPDAYFTFRLPIITSSTGKRYYAKIGSVRERDQYVGEAESLVAIYNAAPGLAPKLLASEMTDQEAESGLARPYFLSEYKDIKCLTTQSAELLGSRLAQELHTFQSPNGYGFQVPTYCGATRQENGWFDTWEDCFSTMIQSLLQKLPDLEELRWKGEEIRTRHVLDFRRAAAVTEPAASYHGSCDHW